MADVFMRDTETLTDNYILLFHLKMENYCEKTNIVIQFKSISEKQFPSLSI